MEKFRESIALGGRGLSGQKVEYGKNLSTGVGARASWGCVPGFIGGGIREGWVVVIDSSPVLNRKFLGSAIKHLVKS